MSKDMMAGATTVQDKTVIDLFLYDFGHSDQVGPVIVHRKDIGSDHYLSAVDVTLPIWSCEVEIPNATEEEGDSARIHWQVHPQDYEKWADTCEFDLDSCMDAMGRNEANGVDAVWGTFRDSVMSMAGKVFKQKRKSTAAATETKPKRSRVHEPSRELLGLIEKRKSAWEEAQRFGQWEKYNQLRRKVRRKAKRETEKELKMKREAIRDNKNKNPKEYWKLLMQAVKYKNKKESKVKSIGMKNEMGVLVRDKEQVKSVWMDAFKKLGNDVGDEQHYDGRKKEMVESELESISMNELKFERIDRLC